MKKIFYLIGLLLLLMTLKPFSCMVDFLDDPVPFVTEWTVSETTKFNGTPDAGKTIKLETGNTLLRIITNKVVDKY